MFFRENQVLRHSILCFPLTSKTLCVEQQNLPFKIIEIKSNNSFPQERIDPKAMVLTLRCYATMPQWLLYGLVKAIRTI